MNLNIIIIILIFTFVYYNYSKMFDKIVTKKSYTLGINSGDKDIFRLAHFLKEFSLEENEIMNIKLYDDNNKLLKDTNDGVIDLSINFEDSIIDSVLGLNSFHDDKHENIEFVCGLYYNHYYFLSSIFYLDENKTETFDEIKDLFNFYDIYKRNYVIGTESLNSISFLSLINMLYIYGFKPIDITNNTDIDSEDYDNKTIFYYVSSEEKLLDEFKNDVVDGVFLVKTNNNNLVNKLQKTKECLFLDITFSGTIFDDIFSSYFKTSELNDFNLDYSFETRSSRVLLVSNNKTDKDVVNGLVRNIFEKNNIIINTLINNDNLIVNHNLFEPIDLVYINKKIPIHKGSYDYFKELGFILTNDYIKKQLDINENEKFKYYWKYDKIGLTKFNLNI